MNCFSEFMHKAKTVFSRCRPRRSTVTLKDLQKDLQGMEKRILAAIDKSGLGGLPASVHSLHTASTSLQEALDKQSDPEKDKS